MEEKTKTTEAELKPMLDALSLRITKPFPIPIYNRLSGFSKCFPWVRLLVNAVAVKIKQKQRKSIILPSLGFFGKESCKPTLQASFAITAINAI